MDIEIKPVSLNKGEKAVVEDLKKYYDENSVVFEDKELYQLRNRSRGSEISFFEAGNFYPDFILLDCQGRFAERCFNRSA